MRKSSRPPLLLLSLLGCVPEGDESDVGDELGESSSADETDAPPDLGAPDLGTPDLGTPDLECELSELAYAPEPLVFPDKTLVPIDIVQVDATLVFDAEAEQAHADARVVFRSQARGQPILDLRQEPSEVLLDGEPLDPDQFYARQLGPTPQDTMRVLAIEVEPCMLHELELRYPLRRPDAPYVDPPLYEGDPAGVYFHFDMSDIHPGRHLEGWIPANMPWDRHPLLLDVQIEAAAEHVVISNGDVVEEGEGAWSIEFPSSTTALAPLLLIRPADGMLHAAGVLDTASGQAIPWSVHVHEALDVTPEAYQMQLLDHIDQLIADHGPYPHDALVVVGGVTDTVAAHRGGMLSQHYFVPQGALASWWGRGVEPATYSDGWIGAGYGSFYVSPQVYAVPPDQGPWSVHDAHPFSRITSIDAQEHARVVFMHLASLMGTQALIAAMRELSAQGLPRSLTTAELERHLYCASGELPEVRQAFHRFVYGREGTAEPLPSDSCD